MRNAETIWFFETVNFRIEFNAAPEDDLDLSWDDTGEVRGLLCTNCNRMIGHAGDSAERLTDAAFYLSSRKLQRSS